MRTIYLEGPLAHAPDGHEWRERFEAELSGDYEIINPLKSVGDFRKVLNELRATWPKLEAQTEFRDIMSTVIDGDLVDVRRADIEVAYLPKEPRAFGTICGLFYFKRVLGKSPSVLITDRTIPELNNWELALSDYIVNSFDEAITLLRKLSISEHMAGR